MKRLCLALASLAWFSASAASDPTPIDPKTLSFSLATINDALPPIDSAASPGATDLVLHKDEWRQFEAISRACDAEMQEELSDVRRIFQEQSRISGGVRVFTGMHLRKRMTRPLPTPLPWPELLAATGTLPAAVVGVAVQGQGMVKDGFSFRVGQFVLYGIRHGESVEVLCFGFTRAPGLSDTEAETFAAFAEKGQWVVVHWPSASVLKDKRALKNYLMQGREKKP